MQSESFETNIMIFFAGQRLEMLIYFVSFFQFNLQFGFSFFRFCFQFVFSSVRSTNLNGQKNKKKTKKRKENWTLKKKNEIHVFLKINNR